MVEVKEKLREFFNNRWLVFVACMWVQTCSGIGYLFGSLSPVIKKNMGYNQRQLAMLAVAKDLGDAIGFVAGSLCEVLPIWAVLFIGVLQNLVGYGLVWLIVSHVLPPSPLWLLCILIFVGTNGETYFNTGALVPCVQNFPKSRGPIVGILKGFAGLSGAIMTQVYVMINFSNESALIFMVAVMPTIVITSVMFTVKPVRGHRQVRPSDNSSFLFVYSVCLILAAYLLAVLLLQDLVHLNQTFVTLSTAGLLLIVLLPIVIPILLVFNSEPRPSTSEESLLPESAKQESINSEQNVKEVIFSELEDEKSSEIDLLPSVERQKRIDHLQAKLFQAAADGAVRVKKRKGPRRGEDFTLMQALLKADFWLIFLSLVLASGSGLTVIDNLGQMSQSLGYANTHVFVSMISIWNFLGRVGGGYFSEIIVRCTSYLLVYRVVLSVLLILSVFSFPSPGFVLSISSKYAYPRPVAMAVVQVIMAFSLVYYAMGLPGAIYVVSVLTGLGYGAHWAIVPAAASELFGLKSFGALYNFLTMSSPAGSLIFSGIIASGIYDYEAKKQASLKQKNLGILEMSLVAEDSLNCYGTICYSLTCGILTVLCLVAAVLSFAVVYRTKRVYAQLYGNPRI